MIERSNFNIFARPNTLQPQVAPVEPAVEAPPVVAAEPEVPAASPHPDPVPEREGAKETKLYEPTFLPEPSPFGSGLGEGPAEGSASGRSWNGTVGGGPALADQLHLTAQTAITLHANLPDQPPQPLAGTTGIYQPSADGDPQTGLAAGTRILTARGEVAVELLQPGDAALGLRGPALLPIAWIGRHAGAKPGVQINPGALGPDMPRRALRLAADHPVFIQPNPVPARSLVNGSSIQAIALHDTELFHIDVGPSDVLFAEGVPLSSDRRAEP